jgi:non-ribosomal peptide synthetase component F
MASQTPQVWLDHQVVEHEGGLLLNWHAVEELFPEGVLDAMFEAYRGLLRALGEAESDWSAPVGSLLPLDQAEVRAKVNATEGPESGRTLCEGFFARAVERPERLALGWGDDGQWS